MTRKPTTDSNDPSYENKEPKSWPLAFMFSFVIITWKLQPTLQLSSTHSPNHKKMWLCIKSVFFFFFRFSCYHTLTVTIPHHHTTTLLPPSIGCFTLFCLYTTLREAEIVFHVQTETGAQGRNCTVCIQTLIPATIRKGACLSSKLWRQREAYRQTAKQSRHWQLKMIGQCTSRRQ